MLQINWDAHVISVNSREALKHYHQEQKFPSVIDQTMIPRKQSAKGYLTMKYKDAGLPDWEIPLQR